MSEWIPVSEKLPVSAEAVLVWLEYTRPHVHSQFENPCSGYQISGSWKIFNSKYTALDVYNALGVKSVTHWMPLPEPPNG